MLPVAWFQGVRDAASENSIEVILRPGGSEFLGEYGLQKTMDFIADQPLVLFQGPTVLGYPGRLDAVAKMIHENEQMFCWVEFDEQDGGGSLAQKMKSGSDSIAMARLHSIPPEEMDNYDIAGAVARYMRAVEERSIRVIYVRPFIRGKQLNSSKSDQLGYDQRLLDLNQKYFQSLSTAVTHNGYVVEDKPTALRNDYYYLSSLYGFGYIVGILTLLLLLAFPMMSNKRQSWSIAIVLAVGMIAIFAFSKGELLLDLFLLLIAIAYPLVGIWLAMHVYMYLTTRLACRRFCPRRIFIALLSLGLASLFSIIGGLAIHGTLASAEGILKLQEFRGVTVSMALPILLFAAWAWQAETLADAWDATKNRLSGYWERFSALWQSPIRYGDVAFILIAMGIIGVVLLRSGNDSLLGVLSIESLFRDGLEQTFGLRPRTKELIGHPLMMLFLLSIAWRTRISVMFGIGALLGQISILNTFCHLHTPLELTMTRVLLGLGLGAVTGLVWCVVAIGVGSLWARIRSSKFISDR